MAVNHKDAAARVREEREALERIRSRSSVSYAEISHPLIRPAEERSFSVHTEADFKEHPFRMSDGTLVRSIVFPNERDYGTDPFCVASDGRAFTLLELPSMSDRLGVVRHADAILEERFREATEAAVFMALRLNAVGIRTVVVGREEARRVFEKEAVADFSVADIQRLNYEWNGEEVSMKAFAQAFSPLIKNRDRTIEDAERIAAAYIEGVKADPAAFVPQLKAENMSHARYFILQDGSVWTPQHPMAQSPEYETQRGLWEIYSRVLGDERMDDFIDLVDPSRRRTADEDARFVAMEREVSASVLMQRTLEMNAEKVNYERRQAVRNLVHYFEENSDYTATEKALILKGAMTWGISEKKASGDATEVRLVKLTDANDLAVPVVGGEAAAIVEGLRKGMTFKDALKEAREQAMENGVRSVPRNYTGWKVYPKSNREEDAVVLNRDASGTGWCTGSGLSTARSHLSGGNFHIYFEAGEPLIAIRTEDGRMAEPPRGAHEGQFCTAREEQIAFEYISQGNGITAGDDYVADIRDIRRVMSPDATWMDAFMMPESRRYNNGEFGGDTRAWGEAVEERIRRLLFDSRDERFKAGYYDSEEIKGFKTDDWKKLKAFRGSLVIRESLLVPSLVYVGETLSVGVNVILHADSLESIGGDLEVLKNATLQANSLGSVGGRLVAYDNATLRADSLESIGGGLYVYDNATLWADSLESIGGGLYVHENATLQADSLNNIGGDLEVKENAILQVDSLKTIGKYLEVYKNATLQADSLNNIGGDLYVSENATLRADSLESIGGGLYVHENATLQADSLNNIGGDLEVKENAILQVDSLESIGGDLEVLKNATLQADSLGSVGGYVVVSDNATLQAASLDNIGGYVDVSDNAILRIPKLKEDFSFSNGVIYGYQIGDTIFLTPDGINPETPIHEYAHVWAKAMQRLSPEKWSSVKAALKTSGAWDTVVRSKGYERLRGDEDRIAGEVLATLTGKTGCAVLTRLAGEKVLGSDGRRRSVEALVGRFRSFVSGFAAREVFGFTASLSPADLTMAVLKDFAEGRNPSVSMAAEKVRQLPANGVDERGGNPEGGRRERMTRTLSEGGPLTREQLEYAFLPLHATDLPHRCADVLRLHGIENLAGVLALDRRQLDSVFSGEIKKKDWLMSCLERHGLQDKFGLKMDSRFSVDVRDYDLKPGRPARRRGVPAKKAKPRTPGL